MKKHLLFAIAFCISFIPLDLVGQNSLAVTVFEDVDGNGLQDGGEPTIAGVLTTELRLWQDVNNNGAIDGADTEFMHDNGGGIYTFGTGNVLPDDNYILEYVEVGAVGSYYVTKMVNGVGLVDMDNDLDPITNTAGFALLGDTPEMNIDLGLVIAGNIGSFVWEDNNGDGIQDGGELGITGSNVTLIDANTSTPVINDINNVPLINPMATDGAGMYSFDNIAPGQYIVQFEAPVPSPNQWFATSFTTDTDASDPTNDSDAENDLGGGIYQSHTIILLSDETDEENKVDAGFFQSVIIGDLVWEDINGNGIQDPGDLGIDGVQVRLLDDTGVQATSADGVTLVPDQTTAGGGLYQFTDVAPGDYQVQFFQPAPIGGVDWYPTEFAINTDADDPANDSDANNVMGPDFLRSHTITLLSGETDEEMRIDAGFWLPAKIGNKVFCDENGNGIDDDGVGGVDDIDVNLFDAITGAIALDADGNPQPLTKTSGGGMYEFDLVPPGEYYVEFSFPGAPGPANPPFVFTTQDQGADDTIDSDVNPAPGGMFGQTPTIEITSQDTDEEMIWDAGVYQLITIAGTVWYDDDMSLTLNGAEGGPAGVLINLYDEFLNKIDDVLTTGGVYEFPSNPGIQLPPGTYIVEIDISAFSGVLNGATPCPGSNDANDMVDNDDNGPDGMPSTSTPFTVLSNCDPTTPVLVEYVDFCYFFNCNTPNSLAATACDEIGDPEIICDINTLTSFCAIMPSMDSPGVQPQPLCQNVDNGSTGGGAHNISWFAFVAYGGSYTVTVTPTNCSGSTTNQEGVQIGLYTDCTFSQAVYCDPACSTNPVSFDSSILEEGQTYYFFIDGCSSSTCSYEVDISGTPLPPNLEPADMCIDNAGSIECTDGNTYCPNADVNFLVQGVELTVDHTWSITTVSGGPFIGDAAPMTLDGMLAVNFANEGEYIVCINNINNGCQNWSGNYCRTVIIAGLDDEEFDLQEVCDLDEFNADFNPMTTLSNGTAPNPVDPNGDATEGWQGTGPANFIVGTNTASITTAQGCMYEQEFDLALYPVSDVGLFDMTFCREDLPVTIDGTQYTEAAFGGAITFSLPGLPLVNETDVNGCDSIIDIELEILDVFNGIFEEIICTPDGLILELDYDVFLSTNESFITWVWTAPNGDVLDDTFDPANPLDNIVPFGTGMVTYTLTATIVKDGVTCTFPHDLEINFDDLLPPTPTIAGSPILICESDSIQTYTATDFGTDVNIFNWTVDGGGTITSGGGITDEMIEINWGTSNSGGSITLTVEGCGVSDEATLNISLIPLLTPDFTVTADVCQDSSSVITFSGATTDIDSYTWDFDGGSINNATGGNGPGPHEVSWSDGGVAHTITLTVMHNGGCVSIETIDVVNTIAPTPVTINQCTSSSGQVIFTWELSPGTAEGDYSVVVLTGQSGTQSGTSYTIDGLGANEVVDIELTLLTGDACVSTTLEASCVAQDCTPPQISITTPGAGPFCLNGTDQSFNLSAVIPAGVPGSGEFSGDGITDVVAGTFDPDAAGVGSHSISYTYQTDDGCTALADPIIFVVNESPVAMFSTVDTICILDAFNITYDGTTGISNSTYTTDDGQSINEFEPSISFSTPGEHTIILSVEKDGCPSLTPFMKTVFVEPELEQINVGCTMQEIDNVAFGWNAVAGATGYSVTVTNPDGSVDPPFITTDLTFAQGGLNPNDSISITVEVISDSRCPVSFDTEKCFANDCPTVDVTIDPTIPLDYCVDGSNGVINLTAVVNSSGDGLGDQVWSGDGVTGTQFDPNGLPEGPVTINVEYTENGCGGYSDNIIVNILQLPTATFDVALDPICIGSTIPITFTGSNLPGQSLDWSGSDITVTPTANPNEYEATFNDVGTFNIMLDVSNGNNCSAASAPSMITVEPELVFGDVDCLPSETEVSFSWAAVDCATDYEIFLTVGTGTEMSQGIQSTTTYVADNLPEGTEVSIRVVAISDCACSDVTMTRSCETSACIQVIVEASVMGGETDFCFANDLPTVDVLTTLTDNTSGGSGTFSGTGVDPVSGTFDPATAGVGTHTILYSWVEPFGCEDDFVDSVTFTIFENPEVTAMADPIECYEDSLTMLNITPTNGDGNYTLTSEGVDILPMSEVTEGTYNILVTDGNGCTAETSETVAIPAEPMPTITGSTELIVGESSNYSIAQSLFTGLAIDSVVWTANGTVICNEVGCFSISNEAPIVNTTYEVTVFYNNGCSVVRSIDVEVTEPDPIYTVDIPNIISPNGDGENDDWQIFTGDPEVIVSSVQIMDRWGNLVFEIAAPYNPATTVMTWNGRFGTSLLQPGVYVYTVRYTQDGRDRVRNGDVTIVDTRR